MRSPRGLKALQALDSVTQAMNVCGTALILALMLLIGADVAGRNLFGRPIPGVPEMVALSIVAIVFLQVPQTLRRGRMPASDAVPGLLARHRPRLGNALADLWDLVGIAVVAVIAQATWPLFLRAWMSGTFVGAVGDFTAPVWPVKVTILLGAVMTGLQFVARIARRHGWGAPPVDGAAAGMA